ncbi:unnamed protein product [Microthlaspi erraticum]|uniref:Uncharacterized protein n=1 Tax=Microthlaspi erraticum TaxID=1685480 RepID=A0A6D2K8C7_9BRAS|nr:unnamed protein product [Microthlaspi erraticum]
MNRVTSSSNAQTKKLPQSQSQPQPQPPAKKERNLKRERLPVNPLRGFTTRSSRSSSCSNGSGSGSGSTSGEASNGCHRFLLSHSFSSSSSSLGVFPQTGSSNRPVRSVAKTPKSAPVVSKPLIRKKPRSLEETKLKPTATDKPQRLKTNPLSGKRLTGSKITMKPEKASILKKQSSVSREVELKDSQTTIRVDDSIAQITPISKLGTGSDLIYRSSNGEEARDDDGRVSSSYEDRTPPVQASISPEIQCGSSSSMNLLASAQSQACYAAGHLLSGVSDKRKCKPKGILTVGENGFEAVNAKILDDFDEVDFGNISMMPLPADASVQWLLSPCDEEKETESVTYDDGFSQLQQVVECVGDHETPSPLSSTSSDLCNITSGKSLSPVNLCKETVRRTSSSLSPNELSRFRRFMQLSSCELDPCEDLKGDKLSSPLSVDTLGSENVIQTPESNSSFDSYLALLSSQGEFQKKLEVCSDMESLTTALESARLSPRRQASSREPSSASFKFESLVTSTDSIDLSQFQRGDAPARKEREMLPCSAAESISTDGGGLVCSEDSNWMECYKN